MILCDRSFMINMIFFLKIKLIEINPRVGGVFVNDSVKIRTHGESMLDLWLYVLLSRVPELQTWKNLEKAQSFFEKNTYGKYIANSFSTFQQIFLGTPGKMVK